MTAPPKRPPGRPRSKARRWDVTLWAAPDQEAAIRDGAEANGETLGAFVLGAALEKAKPKGGEEL